jgi:hypothetical protein
LELFRVLPVERLQSYQSPPAARLCRLPAMKFDKRFYFSTIPEWKDRYLDYAGLCAQIKLIKKAALNLAKAYANIKGT